ncbi:UDP-glucuronosyltransferase 2B31 isoform X1 [Folsomia candida]|uniref:UDP-glucuronosyltransferase 2B31 isoform X1 n=1 Tax=Folsomia candida TaxID=158441 RepID=UPI000B900FD2|nr:UDP-glucuronosyltransferase 2B31 isoform X1 [Folsomia candida]
MHVLISLIIFVAGNANAANILFMHPFGSPSHVMTMMPLADALSSRGHNITYIAPMRVEGVNPKIRLIVPESFAMFVKYILNLASDPTAAIQNKPPPPFTSFDKSYAQSCQVLINSVEFQAWLIATTKIDLVVTDVTPDCGVGIAYKLNAKIIMYSTLPFFAKFTDLFTLPDEALGTSYDLPFRTDSITFIDRIKSTLLPLGWAYETYQVAPFLESVLQEGLKIEKMPSIYDLYKNVSLVLMAGNFITEQARSLPPMFVSVPGLHLKMKHEALPSEMEEFISSTDADVGNEGFVYVSLGTLVVANNLPQSIINVFMNSIRAFPNLKFLWKWDGEVPEKIPRNLFLASWFPQQDVLSHLKIRAFITQAGRPSVQEAIFNAVPMIAFPILFDQDFNAMQLEERGLTVRLDVHNFTDQNLQSALSSVLYDPRFKQRVQKMSNIFTDLPIPPIETAVFWTEYVLRHDHLSHLKPMARNLTWYQRRNLDVWLVLLLAVVMAILCLGIFVIWMGRFVNNLATKTKLKQS